MDITFITNYFYKRYIDDAGNTGHSKEEADLRMLKISDQDEYGLLKWEVDFPASLDQFTPFLNSEIRIEADGTVESRLYRKPHSKDITLHRRFHHPTETKIATIRSSYKEADYIASDIANKQISYDILDKLYINNGYKNLREFLNTNKKKKKKKNILRTMVVY